MSFNFIAEELAQQQAKSLFRKRYVVEQSNGRTIIINKKAYLNFASNDYLGLSSRLLDYDIKFSNAGSTSSALVTGYHKSHQELENYLCDLMGYEACLLFSSGFTANASVLKTLMNSRESILYQDKLNHASLLDGGLASAAKQIRFRHNDMKHLKHKLESTHSENKLIVSEGVFSMDGDSAPIDDLQHIAKQHHAWLMVDDAHGFGVSGKNGLGSCDPAHQYTKKIDILVLTFGKAVATSGACILCTEQVKDYLLQFNRDYIYSTAISPLMATITLDAIKKLVLANEERAILKTNIAYFKEKCLASKIPLIASDSPIQPVLIGDAQKALEVSDALKGHSIWLTAIRPPTVPQNTARLRVTITAKHQLGDINLLVQALSGTLN